MRTEWTYRNPIVANLFNPAFCGEAIRRTIKSYNDNSKESFPFALSFLILPLLLHKRTRERMPKSTASYLFAWVENNDDLFYNFSQRAKDMVPFTKESIMFLLQNKHIDVDQSGGLNFVNKRQKRIQGDDLEEFDMIMKNTNMLGKWLAKNSNVNSIYSFFRIIP